LFNIKHKKNCFLASQAIRADPHCEKNDADRSTPLFNARHEVIANDAMKTRLQRILPINTFWRVIDNCRESPQSGESFVLYQSCCLAKATLSLLRQEQEAAQFEKDNELPREHLSLSSCPSHRTSITDIAGPTTSYTNFIAMFIKVIRIYLNIRRVQEVLCGGT